MSRRRNTGYQPGALALAILLCAQLIAVLVWLVRMGWHYTGALYLHHRKLAQQASLDRALQLATQRPPLYVVPNQWQQPPPQYWPLPPQPQYHHTPPRMPQTAPPQQSWTTYDDPWH